MGVSHHGVSPRKKAFSTELARHREFGSARTGISVTLPGQSYRPGCVHMMDRGVENDLSSRLSRTT